MAKSDSDVLQLKAQAERDGVAPEEGAETDSDALQEKIEADAEEAGLKTDRDVLQ